MESTITLTMQTYTKREIAHLLGVSPRTIADDSKFLQLKPIEGDRGTKLYNKNDLNLITQLREHCADKANSRESFVERSLGEIVPEPELKITKMNSSALVSAVPKQDLFNSYCDRDPLYDLDLLSRIADNNYLLPTSRLAPILNLSPQYLCTLKSYFYCGFIIKPKTKENGRVYWQVRAN